MNNQLFHGRENNHGTHETCTIAGTWKGKGITGIADSNYGAVSVDFEAPGTYILSTTAGEYGFMTDTSMAAPRSV